ncbi:S-adenosyl-L-methionine-dependent methyltransferase [Metarhizium brunneum]
MSFRTTGEGYALHHVINGYAWSALGAATVVDVGGSHGDAAFALAREFPHLQLVVQDLPQVVASCKEQPGLNVRFMSHDFFEEQPFRDAHVYLYRWIFHNWPDTALDVTMLEIGNSKERDLDEWKQLFRQADERYVFRGTTQPPGSNLAILRADWSM